MVKASQGRTSDYNKPFADPEFRSNMERITKIMTAGDGGIYAGAYHYFCARNERETDEEADFFINTVLPFKSSIRLWSAIDVEDSGFLPQNKAELSSLVKRFCDKVKSAGLRPMVYSGSWWLNNRFSVPAGVPIWEANWSADKFPARARMWQYSSAGKVNGISGNVDMNLAFDIIGDANGDGKVDYEDVSDMLKYAAEWNIKLDEGQADIDLDGRVTVNDIKRLLQIEDGK